MVQRSISPVTRTRPRNRRWIPASAGMTVLLYDSATGVLVVSTEPRNKSEAHTPMRVARGESFRNARNEAGFEETPPR